MLHLVPGGRRVEKPDVMTFAVFGIGKTKIAALPIEYWLRTAVTGCQPGLFDRQRIGPPIVPVIGVVAQRNDNARTVNTSQSKIKLPDKPGLRRDRAGYAALPVLVITHQDQPVSGTCQVARRPVQIVNRHRHADQTVLAGEDHTRLCHQFDQIRHGCRVQVFKVIDDPVVAAAIERL